MRASGDDNNTGSYSVQLNGVYPPPVHRRPYGLTRDALVSICFLNATKGWVLSVGGTLLQTADGGQSWTSQQLWTQPHAIRTNLPNPVTASNAGLSLRFQCGHPRPGVGEFLSYASVGPFRVDKLGASGILDQS